MRHIKHILLRLYPVLAFCTPSGDLAAQESIRSSIIDDVTLETASFRLLQVLKASWSLDSAARRAALEGIEAQLSSDQRAVLTKEGPAALAKAIRVSLERSAASALEPYVKSGLTSIRYLSSDTILGRRAELIPALDQAARVFTSSAVFTQSANWLNAKLSAEIGAESDRIRTIALSTVASVVRGPEQSTSQLRAEAAALVLRFRNSNDVSNILADSLAATINTLTETQISGVLVKARQAATAPISMAAQVQKSGNRIKALDKEIAKAISLRTDSALNLAYEARNKLDRELEPFKNDLMDIDSRVRNFSATNLADARRDVVAIGAQNLIKAKRLYTDVLQWSTNGTTEQAEAINRTIKDKTIRSVLGPVASQRLEQGWELVRLGARVDALIRDTASVKAQAYLDAAGQAAADLRRLGIIKGRAAVDFVQAVRLTSDVVKIGAAFAPGGDPMAGISGAMDLLSFARAGGPGQPRESPEVQMLKGLSRQLEGISKQLETLSQQLDALAELTRRSFNELAEMSATNHTELMSAVATNTEWTKLVAQQTGAILRSPLSTCTAASQAIRNAFLLSRSRMSVRKLADIRSGDPSINECIRSLDLFGSKQLGDLSIAVSTQVQEGNPSSQNALQTFDKTLFYPSVRFFCRQFANIDTLFVEVPDSLSRQCSRSSAQQSFGPMKVGVLRLLQPAQTAFDTRISLGSASRQATKDTIDFAVLLDMHISPAALDSVVSWTEALLPLIELTINGRASRSFEEYTSVSQTTRRTRAMSVERLLRRELELSSYAVGQWSLVSGAPFVEELRSALNDNSSPQTRELAVALAHSNPWIAFNLALVTLDRAMGREASTGGDCARLCIGSYRRLWDSLATVTSEAERTRLVGRLNSHARESNCACAFSFATGGLKVSSKRWVSGADSVPVAIFAPSPDDILNGTFAFPPQIYEVERTRARILQLLASRMFTLRDFGLSGSQIRWLLLQ